MSFERISNSMDKTSHWLIFSLAGQKFAFALFAVTGVVRAVEITPVPEAPDLVLGVVNIKGRVIPVINIRKRLGLPEREMDLKDLLMIARTPERTIAFLVDAVSSVREVSGQQRLEGEEMLTVPGKVVTLLKLPEGLIPVLNPESLLPVAKDQDNMPVADVTMAVGGKPE
jgi:purine-binding chemotaxis protein CheW